MPAEPNGTAKDAIRVSIRMPSGERVVRRFEADSDLEQLYAFVDCYGLPDGGKPTEEVVLAPDGYEHVYDFRLVSPLPRAVYDARDGGSIGGRVGNGANLIVEPLNEPDDSEDDTQIGHSSRIG